MAGRFAPTAPNGVRLAVATAIALAAATPAGCDRAVGGPVTRFPTGPGDAFRLAGPGGCAGPDSDGWTRPIRSTRPRHALRCRSRAEALAAARPDRDAGPPRTFAAAPATSRAAVPNRAAPAAPRPSPSAAPPRPAPPAPGDDAPPPEAGHGPPATGDAVLALSPAACRNRLEAEGVAVVPAPDAPEAVEQPVRIAGPVAGVDVRLAWAKDPEHDVHAVFDCRLVVALLPVARLVGARGYDTLEYVSATRRGGRPRRLHRKGLAVDVVAVRRGGERTNVEAGYRRGNVGRCKRGRMPRDVFGAILCRAWRGGWFHTILGPDHDRAHRDHLHLDLAPHRKPPRTPYVGLAGASAGDLPRRSRSGGR